MCLCLCIQKRKLQEQQLQYLCVVNEDVIQQNKFITNFMFKKSSKRMDCTPLYSTGTSNVQEMLVVFIKCCKLSHKNRRVLECYCNLYFCPEKISIII